MAVINKENDALTSEKKTMPMSEEKETGETETGKQETEGERAAREDKPDMVEFYLFKDNDKYSAPVFVGVNGMGYLLKRGETVKMPRAVYEVLKNSEQQISEAGKIMQEAEYPK